MLRLLSALGLVVAMTASAVAQCNPQPRLDQTNLNLGQILSSGASAGGCANGQCNQVAPSAASAAAVSNSAAMGQPNMDQLVAAVLSRMAAQGYATNEAKPLRVGGASAAASAVAGGAYVPQYAPTPVPAPPAQPLAAPVMFPVALALPANSATASAAVADAGGGCGGRRGFFRRATRSRTRAVTVVDGQRTVSSSSAVSR